MQPSNGQLFDSFHVGRRIAALDFYRYIAAISVVAFHFIEFAGYDRTRGIGFWISDFGLFVDFFFILSGFVLGLTYARSVKTPQKIFQFLRRRIARIWPLHLLTTLGFVSIFVFGYSSNPENYRLGSIIEQLLLVQSWQINAPLPLNFPAWSISAEWAMYLIFPALVWLRFKVGLAAIAGIAMLGAIAIETLLFTGYMHIPVWNALRAVPTFCIGIVISQIFETIKIKRGDYLGLLTLSAATLLMCIHANQYLVLTGFCLTVFFTASGYAYGDRQLFDGPISRTLGDTSYSVYMLHALIFTLFFKALRPHIGTSGSNIPAYWILILAVVITAASLICYISFESPARKLIAGKRDK
jgi:peptidoglycan/LPS O-acetylase OafA/YrhL